MDDSGSVIEKVCRALGRDAPLPTTPTPPPIPEPIARLVHAELGLPELFARVAGENQIGVTLAGPDSLPEKLVEFLNAASCKRIAVAVSPLLEQLQVVKSLRAGAFDVRTWDELTLDDLYDFDCGVTDVFAAVAEVGAMVIRGSAEHCRALSLVPPVHVAILQPRNFVPDLMDLFGRLSGEQDDSFVLITGPSKTADIEMNIVTGVHGPGVVQAFIVQ